MNGPYLLEIAQSQEDKGAVAGGGEARLSPTVVRPLEAETQRGLLTPRNSSLPKDPFQGRMESHIWAGSRMETVAILIGKVPN